MTAMLSVNRGTVGIPIGVSEMTTGVLHFSFVFQRCFKAATRMHAINAHRKLRDGCKQNANHINGKPVLKSARAANSK